MRSDTLVLSSQSRKSIHHPMRRIAFYNINSLDHAGVKKFTKIADDYYVVT
jgi:hypothetical protein